MEKLLRDIALDEWVRHRWLEVTPMSSTERVFLETGPRSPSEMVQAAREFAALRPIAEIAETTTPDGVDALGYCGP
jgi:hypothetical protein